MANCGGIEVESNWERVKRLCLDIGQSPSRIPRKLKAKPDSRARLPRKMAEFAGKMFACFDSAKTRNISEVNPVVLRAGDDELVALDAVTLLDGDAKFRHPD